MDRKKGFLAAGGLLAATAIIAFVVATHISVLPALELYDGRGLKKDIIPLEDAVFIHHYIHSIHKTPVDEEFIVSGKKLELQRVRYDTYGVGMPSDGGDSFRIENNRFVVDMKRSFEKIDIRVSPVPGHGLYYNGAFHPFTEWVPIESLITLRAGGKYMVVFGRKLDHEQYNQQR